MPPRRSVLTFLALVFLLSVPFWAVGAMTDLMLPLGLPVAALAFVCPGLAAAILAYRHEGPDGVRRLVRRVLDRGRAVPRRWYVVSVVAPLALVLLQRAVVLPVAGLPVPPLHAPLAAIPVLVVLFFVAAAFEEAGWTGYAADPLQERFGALVAGLLLGVVWAAWHLVPLLQAGHAADWMVWWVVGTVAVRVPMMWIYNHGSSVLGTVLFHCMLNVSGYNYGPSYSLAAVAVTIVVLSAAIAYLWGPRTLARYRYAAGPATR